MPNLYEFVWSHSYTFSYGMHMPLWGSGLGVDMHADILPTNQNLFSWFNSFNTYETVPMCSNSYNNPYNTYGTIPMRWNSNNKLLQLATTVDAPVLMQCVDCFKQPLTHNFSYFPNLQNLHLCIWYMLRKVIYSGFKVYILSVHVFPGFKPMIVTLL